MLEVVCHQLGVMVPAQEWPTCEYRNQIFGKKKKIGVKSPLSYYPSLPPFSLPQPSDHHRLLRRLHA